MNIPRSGDWTSIGNAGKSHGIGWCSCSPSLRGEWDSGRWGEVSGLLIDWFHPAGSAHRPITSVRLLHDGRSLYCRFRVEDRCVRSVQTSYQSAVFEDSCVELFVQPSASGYFNFEVNCGGTLLAHYNELHVSPDGVQRRRVLIHPLDATEIEIATTMPRIVNPEIVGPVEWILGISIPFRLMEKYAGSVGDVCGQVWRANFYKCGDKTSLPHWGTWSPVGETLSFHQSDKFGTIHFESP